ncbi:Leucine rich repeat containing protein BspA family protein [Entamoeba marina]
MQAKRTTNDCKRVDSYSALICSKYFKTEDDFVNLICVNSKFKETTEKLRFNPISIDSLKLFPKIQTQYLYSKDDIMINSKQIGMYEIWYIIDYEEYTRYENINNVKCHSVEYTKNNRITYGDEIPNGVTLLGDKCFQWCKTISSIDLPSSLTSLGDRCFQWCSTLSSINLPSSLTSLGDNCFQWCETLSNVNLSSSTPLQFLSDRCFQWCSSLSSINLPSSLTSLGDNCFQQCSSLSLINLPSSLTSLGKCCFHGCDKLKGVINVNDY